jgi:hypothetical protein
MPPITALAFDNTYARLPPDFHEVRDPIAPTNPHLVAFNPDAAALLDLEPGDAAPDQLAPYLCGARRIPGAEPIAMRYAGHQFGIWVPQLGDGRALLLGEVRNRRGEKWDLHLKGGGPTRFARGGDGRSVLRSVIREYLAGEAMHGLGVPTTRALAVVGSDDTVQREGPEIAATLLRLAPSHVRFGTIEAFASRGRADLVRLLVDYVIRHDAPGLEGRYAEWLRAVVVRTARLIAEWMAVGFAHGVMNTDNMSIVGITLDYGPFCFLDEFDPTHIGNHSDPEGRYAFDQQPGVGLWNLERLAEALGSLVSPGEKDEVLRAYGPAFEEHMGRRIRAKLGLATAHGDDAELVRELFRVLRAQRADYTRFFRVLSRFDSSEGARNEPLQAALDGWLRRYRARLTSEGSRDPEREARMVRVNPAYILRNWLAERAIRQAVDEQDYGEIERLRRLLRYPFAEQLGCEEYAARPPAWARELVVSCSS